MVERRDRADAFQRLAGGEDLARLAVGRDVTREDLPIVEDRKLAREREDVVGAADLVERVLLAQAALGGDQVGDLVAALGQDLARAHQDPLALVAGEPGLVASGDGEGLAHLLARRALDRADHGVVVGIEDLDLPAAAGHLLPGDAQQLAADGGDRRGCGLLSAHD